MYEVRMLVLLMLDVLDNYDYQIKVQLGVSTLFHLAKLTEVLGYLLQLFSIASHFQSEPEIASRTLVTWE